MNEVMAEVLLKETGGDDFAKSYMHVWLVAIRVSIRLEGQFGQPPYVKVTILRDKLDIKFRVSVRLLTSHVTRDVVLETNVNELGIYDPRLGLLEQALYQQVVHELQNPPQGGLGIL